MFRHSIAPWPQNGSPQSGNPRRISTTKIDTGHRCRSRKTPRSRCGPGGAPARSVPGNGRSREELPCVGASTVRAWVLPGDRAIMNEPWMPTKTAPPARPFAPWGCHNPVGRRPCSSRHARLKNSTYMSIVKGTAWRRKLATRGPRWRGQKPAYTQELQFVNSSWELLTHRFRSCLMCNCDLLLTGREYRLRTPRLRATAAKAGRFVSRRGDRPAHDRQCQDQIL